MTEQHEFTEIRADRACIGCGFNLFGQSVSKEEHYGLAICRCPECGTVAALQSYPAMSHWVNRFRAILAAIWIVLLMGVFFGHTMAITGMAQGAGSIASEDLGGIIGQSFYEWEQAKAEEALAQNPTPVTNTTTTPTIPGLPPGTTVVTNNGVTTINGVVVSQNPVVSTSSNHRWEYVSKEWVQNHLSETLASSGGLLKNIDPEFLIMYIPGTIVSLVLGIFWSIALISGSRKRVLLVPLVISLIAISLQFVFSSPETGPAYASNIAQSYYGRIVGPFYIATLLLMCSLGVLLGRSLARWVVVMALPPRNRVPLSILWTCDHKPLPKP